MQVLLVVVFGIVERFRSGNFRRDLTIITGGILLVFVLLQRALTKRRAR